MGGRQGPVDLADPERRETWKAELAGVLRDRLVICALGPLAAQTNAVRMLHRYGARTPLVLAAGTGAGPVPSADDARICFLSPPATATLSAAARQTDGYLRHGLSAEVLAEIEDYDPEGEAVWLVDPFVDVRPLLGR